MEKKQLRANIKAYLRSVLDGQHYSYIVSLVEMSETISENYELNKRDKQVLELATWFQNTPELLNSFPDIGNIEPPILQKANSLIDLKTDPSDPLEKIFLDTIFFYYGSKGFKRYSEMMRLAAGIGRQQWLTTTINDLKEHQYYTDYGRLNLQPAKQARIEKLDSELTELLNNGKNDRSDRSIETMFKISASNHQHLSGMADNKAHILITVNSIILSILISVLLRKLDEDAYLSYPTFVLLAVSVLSITISIIAIRPVVHDKTSHHPGDAMNNSTNLLFFGNVSAMHFDAFLEKILGTMDNKDNLYLMLIRNAYLHSVVLGRKSRLLKTAYNIFMYGLIVSVLAFIAVSIFHTPQPSSPVPPVAPLHLSPKLK